MRKVPFQLIAGMVASVGCGSAAAQLVRCEGLKHPLPLAGYCTERFTGRA